jgi:DNA processing protein
MVGSELVDVLMKNGFFQQNKNYFLCYLGRTKVNTDTLALQTYIEKMHAQEVFCQVALTFVPQIGPITARSLVAHFGSAEAVLKAKPSELVKVNNIGPATVAEFKDLSLPLALAEKEVNWAMDQGVEIISLTDERYPDRLKECPDAPLVFYFKGCKLELLKQLRVIALVGTRIPTDYGRLLCEEITEGLKEYDVAVVSGLAFGIDHAAHRTANAHGIPNFGVMGTGLSMIYPEEHLSLTQKMLTNGGLISEFAHYTGPQRENFPMRNRIIAGLCQGLVVIETADKGGSMITAELALGYNRDLFAVPGRSKDSKSRGCNKLIKTNKASMVESAADIAACMGWHKGKKVVQASLFVGATPECRAIMDTVRAHPEIQIDDLSFKCGLSGGLLASHILDLEFQGVLKTLPGKRYILVQR